DIVPYIRVIMHAKGWQVGAACQDRWLGGASIPAKNDAVAQDILKMQWAIGFSHISRLVEQGFNTITSSDQSVALRDILKERIKAQVQNGLVRLPAADGETDAFGTKAQDLEIDKDGHYLPRFNRYWLHEISFKALNVSTVGAVPTVTISPLDDFLAAVANCTIRYIALGQITKTGKTFKVSVTELGAYILDDFHFKGDQHLGYWNVKTNNVGLTSIGGGLGSTAVSNATYR